jgi:hypothetical protein
MDNRKFEQLIDLIINENEDQAKALFHDIVVEKSREIYESMMADEMDEGVQARGQVGDLLDEISAEESGVIEGDDEDEFDIDDSEDVIDIEGGGDDEFGDEVNAEDRLVSIEDKLDQLMAEFENIMSDEDGEGDESDAEFDDGAEEAGNDLTKDMEADHDEEDAMMEAITLKKVPVTHGDNGQQTKSTVAFNSGSKGMASKPVTFTGASESVPTSPKGPSNAYSKGETSVKNANNWKNAPAQNNADLESAPKPKTGDNGSNTKSVIESRKIAKKRI